MKNHVRNRRSGIDMGRVTLSIGIAEANATDTLATLLARADRCLYHAKKTGRNQVVIQDDLPSVFPEDPPIILSRNEQRARMVR
jgi:c-di-AMP phosphodiesterase-like protein